MLQQKNKRLIAMPAIPATPAISAISTISAIPALSALAMVLLSACSSVFDDPVLELNPNRNERVSNLRPQDHYMVTKVDVLESFGAFGCVSCPEAEEELIPFYHPGNSDFNPNLLVVNYHSPFNSPIKDNWVTPATESVYNLYGFTSLPQVILNGSNTFYGFQEKDLPFQEYRSLLQKLKSSENESYLEIQIDTSSLVYGESAFTVEFDFDVLNRSLQPISGVTYRVLAVKNQPVTHPKWEGVSWEVIVTGVSSQDSKGQELAAPQLAALTRASYSVKISLPNEFDLHFPPLPVEDVEKIRGYALLVIAFGNNQKSLNAVAYQYNPE